MFLVGRDLKMQRTPYVAETEQYLIFKETCKSMCKCGLKKNTLIYHMRSTSMYFLSALVRRM